jgi:hypothetical protein
MADLGDARRGLQAEHRDTLADVNQHLDKLQTAIRQLGIAQGFRTSEGRKIGSLIRAGFWLAVGWFLFSLLATVILSPFIWMLTDYWVSKSMRESERLMQQLMQQPAAQIESRGD